MFGFFNAFEARLPVTLLVSPKMREMNMVKQLMNGGSGGQAPEKLKTFGRFKLQNQPYIAYKRLVSIFDQHNAMSLIASAQRW